MKKYFSLATALLFLSCSYESFDPDSWSVTPQLELGVLSVETKWDETSLEIDVQTNYNEFEVGCSEDWCRAVADQEGRKVFVSMDKNMEKQSRTCIVTVSIHRGSSSLAKEVSITQRGAESEVINGIEVHWDSSLNKEAKTVISGIIANMVYVQGGTFYMGAQSKDPAARNYVPNEYSTATLYAEPVHKVTLSDFYICKYEMTQMEWKSLIEANPSTFIGGNLPVDGVKYKDAVELMSRLSDVTGLQFSLPTEAQWEYAARGGRNSLGYYYPGSSSLKDVGFANITLPVESVSYRTYEGGQYQSNELGIYDMAGNVAELCLDFFGDYSEESVTDPLGPSDGALHVHRGGCFCSSPLECLVFSRLMISKFIGLRLVIND